MADKRPCNLSESELQELVTNLDFFLELSDAELFGTDCDGEESKIPDGAMNEVPATP